MAESTTRRRAVSVILLPALAGGVLLAVLLIYFQRGVIPGDAFTYLAAGERLNAGHQLYALGPGDRPVDLKPPYWTVPLLSPPLIGVVFRPLALLGDAGAYGWWLACVAAIAGAVVTLMRRQPVASSFAVLAMAVPLAYEIGVGNVNGLLLAAAIGVWLLARRGRVGLAGGMAAVMVAVKLTPLPMAGWVAGIDLRRGSAGLAAGAIAAGLVAIVGAGVQAHLQYLSVVRSAGASGLTPLSPGGIAQSLGLPDPVPMLLPIAILVGGTFLSAALAVRARPGVGFAVAVTVWTFGSPVVNVNTPILLLALLAPLAWPWSLGPATGRSHPTPVSGWPIRDETPS